MLAMPGASPSTRKRIVKDVCHGLKAHMARGSIISGMIIAGASAQLEQDCSHWRKLAADLGVLADLPSPAHVSALRQLFQQITADMLTAYQAHKACTATSVKGVWDYRSARGGALCTL